MTNARQKMTAKIAALTTDMIKDVISKLEIENQDQAIVFDFCIDELDSRMSEEDLDAFIETLDA